MQQGDGDGAYVNAVAIVLVGPQNGGSQEESLKILRAAMQVEKGLGRVRNNESLDAFSRLKADLHISMLKVLAHTGSCCH